MNAYYRLRILTSISGEQLAELTLRTETTIVVSRSDIQRLQSLELEGFGLKDAITQISQITNQESMRIPENQRKFFDTGFSPVVSKSTQAHTFDVIERIIKEFDATVNTRLEGRVPNLSLVFSRAAEVTRIMLTESNLPQILAVVKEEQSKGSANSEVNVASFEKIVAAIILAVELWRLYREEQDRNRDEKEREEKRHEREQKEDNGARNDQSDGGPAAVDLIDKIGRTA